MKIGVIGLGLMGYPIARTLHEQGHAVTSWTRRPRDVPWSNSTQLSNETPREVDYLIVASGSARPMSGNVIGEISSTYDLVSTRFEKNGPRIIYLSSGAVYGECTRPRSENEIVNPTTEYGLAKFASEQAFTAGYGDYFCALRIGNIIDWQTPYGVLQAMSDAISQYKMVFFGDPTDCRDYVSIHDLTSTISRIIETGVFPNVLNVGSGIEMRLGDLAKYLQQGAGNRIEIVWREIGFGQIRQTKLDVSMLKTTLEISPRDPRRIFEEFLALRNS